jgi:decaprenylphospho-beta-D-ribofuranose 2-oxidase
MLRLRAFATKKPARPACGPGPWIPAALVLVTLGCGAGHTGERSDSVLVAAASDLAIAMPELVEGFARQTGLRVEVTLGSSGQLAHQIAHGAPVDVIEIDGASNNGVDAGEEPAVLDGYGPIPPSMARRLVGNGAGSFLRVLTDRRTAKDRGKYYGYFSVTYTTAGACGPALGGAIAADVHGKNHHTQGSFGDHVEWLDLITADGVEHRLSPDGADPDLFWATIGGMGLTGVVTRAKIRLQRVESAYFTVDTDRTRDLDDLLTQMSTGDENYTYSGAWCDAVTRGRGLGRAVLTRGEKAKLEDLPAKLRRDPMKFAAPSFGTFPDLFPSGLVNRATGKAFSLAWYFKAPKHRVGEIQNITQFFHPLDMFLEWNRVYGPPGFLQYQFAVPFSAAETFAACVREIANSGQISCINVLKRFGEGNASPLSFPTPGWTLAVDFPITDGLDRLCRRLDELVLGVGGRVYLAKDSRIDADSLRLMYPRLDDFLAVRRRVDPDGIFVSDLARRLQLV